jgi:hypothetical protein
VAFTAGLAAAAFATAASAHGGEEALLVVPIDHVTQGRPFPLVGSDFGEAANVSVELHAGRRVFMLRRVTAAPNGHFRTTLVVPKTVPKGYAQVVASDPSGSHADVWILIGPRTEARPTPAVAVESNDRSPVVTALVLALVAAVLVAGGLLVARRVRPPR